MFPVLNPLDLGVKEYVTRGIDLMLCKCAVRGGK
jgi:hypothetical protein